MLDFSKNMKQPGFLTVLLLLGVVATTTRVVSADLLLNQTIMELAKTAAHLSWIAYSKNPPSDGYDSFKVLNDVKDQVIVAKKTGYCFLAFRGTTAAPGSGAQNSAQGRNQVCNTVNGTQSCCIVPSGFYGAYNSAFRAEMEGLVRSCAASCTAEPDCLVVTGNSLGGGIANVAALHFADLNPYVFPYGSSPAVGDPCNLINAPRWFRFHNSRVDALGHITYDPVPSSPFYTNLKQHGYMMLITDDPTGVANYGLNTMKVMKPFDLTLDSHRMKQGHRPGAQPGYYDRISALVAQAKYPVRTTGWSSGSPCTEDKECVSGKCQSLRFTNNKKCA